MRKLHLIWSIFLWTIIIAASFVWNYSILKSNNQDVVLNKSQAFFEQMLTTRAWGSEHGGVYAPITETTLPNPYLIDSLRDVVTLEGLQLTKINPAYMTRQISEINEKYNDIQFHITSLNPIRPANKADLWETKALNLFEENIPEILELVKNDTVSEYRYMAPLLIENSCLDCHAAQGYKLGEIRGGISVSFPATLYLKFMKERMFSYTIIHFLILAFGIIGILVFYRMQKKYYSIIKNKNAELIHINSTKDKVFSIIAHDLRNPFNSILGYTDLLVSDYEILDENQRKKYITQIDKSSKSAFDLLENLLLWARTQRDKIEINKESLNLNNLIAEALNVLLGIAKKKSINIDTDISGKFFVYADAFTMKTIIANLVSNAIKFTPENGKITIDASQTSEIVEIRISDNGVGIPLETMPKLFLADQSISALGTNNEKGTGLGLVLCKEFIEKNGGEIDVESVMGKGTKFIIKIPVYTKQTT
jgi:signal transduction histidine kinase